MLSLRQPSRAAVAAWTALAASCAVWVLVLVLAHQPFHVGQRALRYFDLKIYVAAAHRLVHGVPLYATPLYHGLGFTYPPLSAMLFAPFDGLAFSVIAGIVTAANVGLLVVTLRCALRIADRRGAVWTPAIGSGWACAAGAAAIAIWIEPISVTLGYGQVDLLIAALVVFDLSRADRARTKGAAIGLAAAIKLTPLLFIVFLAISGRRRAAAIGAGVFGAAVALDFASVPADARSFWLHRLAHGAGVGNYVDPSNQSLRGMIARLGAGGSSLEVIWLVASVIVAVLALALARGQVRGGDDAAAYTMVALATLLVSPISWTHHWALAVPALLLLARRASTRRSWSLALVTLLLVAIGCSYVPEFSLRTPSPTGPLTLLTCDPYVLVGLVAIIACAVAALRARRRAGTGGSRRPGVALPG